MLGAAAQFVKPPPCPPKDLACAREAMKTHPAKQPGFWKAALARPLEDRIGPAPPELIEILAIDNLAQGYPNQPRVPVLTSAFIADVKRMLAELPEPIRRKVAPRLAGIYFVDDIGGTGFADAVLDPTGQAHIGFIVLDPSVLMARTANAWATWKDNTPFKPDPAWSLATRIEAPSRDDTARAIQYILLHELGHVLSIGEKVHPPWTEDASKLTSTAQYGFFKLSWKIAGGKYVALPRSDFPQRSNVVFYFGAKLPGHAMKETYIALERTDFPTLYASTHPGDDFAEAFANYVHVVLMGKPFELRIAKAGKVVHTYRACWSQQRCAAKRAFLEDFLNKP